MLVLSRRSGQAIRVGGDVTITVLRVEGDRIVLGIEAPREVRVVRAELLAEVGDEVRAAADGRDGIAELVRKG